MGKIVFLNPFGTDKIYGGVKVTYQHAAILSEAGHEVMIYQPAGRPTWLDVSSRITVCDHFSVTEDDIIVFPEILKDMLLELARTPLVCTKVLFCQNPFYLYSYNHTGEDLTAMGFSHFIVPGRETAQSFASILRLPNVHVIPNSVDRSVFYPRPKQLCIATNPRKWPGEGGNSALSHMIMSMLHLKYPETRDIPWYLIENMSQQEVAEIMGFSAIFLALSRQEALPLTPLEAMASRCALVGFHGTGGKDYATHRNGHWYSPEQCEEIVDCLAQLVSEFKQQSPRIDRMLSDAEKTADQYSVAATKEAVLQVYSAICSRPDA